MKALKKNPNIGPFTTREWKAAEIAFQMTVEKVEEVQVDLFNAAADEVAKALPGRDKQFVLDLMYEVYSKGVSEAFVEILLGHMPAREDYTQAQ